MFRRTLPILMAIMLAACPVTCRAVGWLARLGAAQPAECATCCQCAAGEDQRPSDGEPNRSPLPTCPCQEESRDWEAGTKQRLRAVHGQ